MKAKKKNHKELGKVLTEDEFIDKMQKYNAQYTQKERIDDLITDLFGYLVATRDGHRYRFGISGAMAKLLKLGKKVEEFS